MLKADSPDGPIVVSSPAPARADSSRLVTTYEDIWKFKPRRVVESDSVDEIRSAVAEASSAGLRVRAIGFGMSWAAHLVTNDVCVSLRKLNRIHRIDPVNKTVVVDAGVRLGDLSRALAEKKLSLPSLSFLPDLTIGGAVATATHGTSPNWGTLSDFVRSMDVVLASGEVRKFGPKSSPEELHAARVAIGMLGVIVRLELQVIDQPWVRFSQESMDLSTLRARLPSILSKYEHVWVHWTLGEDRVMAELLETSPSRGKGFHPYNGVWRPSNRVIVQMFNRIGISTSSLLQLRDRYLGFVKSAKGGLSGLKQDADRGKVFMSMQYALPTSQIEIAIDRIRNSNFASQNPGRIVEMKFLRGQDLSYLGPNCDGDAVGFNLWWLVDEPTKLTVFDSFEKTMKSMNARPHWGKFHTPPSIEYMQAAYPRWAEFESVRARLDPTGTFSIFRRDSMTTAPHIDSMIEMTSS
jgi:L-gulonolactone oxidase